ncbi:MAG TPA: hypothetical protein DCG57_02225 [Candidatus Riflebacteria bacterium]|nr:hypothetical protein [Candidatus Riflebacteria bacterium]
MRAVSTGASTHEHDSQKIIYESRRIYIRFAGTHQQYDRINVEII